ncbi:tyrosine-type recombinase/integrase [Streptomyces mirabilis]|uniref:tyrosine-type recombinase/integrase n=1 Tax=Streptomyces mirabilis TaxID=68239 RepID=UPI0033297B20
MTCLSGPCCRRRRSSAWPMRLGRVTGCSSSWRRSRRSASASWLRCVAGTSTWPAAWSWSAGRKPSCRTGGSSTRRPSRPRGCARSPSPVSWSTRLRSIWSTTPLLDRTVTCSSGRSGQLRRSNFRDDWVKARKDAGVTAELHFHDLRHTDNTLASTAGASTRELMTRMGHSSSRAALIYQHMTSDRDRTIADRLGAMTATAGETPQTTVTRAPYGRSGTRVARRRKR